MRRLRLISLAATLAATVLATLSAAQTDAAWTASLQDIRRTAALVPGPRPVRLNVLTFAESRRTKNFSVKDAPAEPSVQARTAFQVVYPGSHVMVDAGMDIDVHRFFGRGADEPYDAAAADQLARAVRAAQLVVVTHEHGDHVAGVVRTPFISEIAPRTILTRAQIDTLIARPQMPEIQLSADRAARYIVVDYDKYFPLAPGMALVKAPGHTPGSQMVYVALESGREYLLIGDAAWHMDGVRLVRGKDAPWVTEDAGAVLDQLRWLNGLSRSDPRLTIVPSHDEEQLTALVQEGLISNRLELR